MENCNRKEKSARHVAPEAMKLLDKRTKGDVEIRSLPLATSSLTNDESERRSKRKTSRIGRINSEKNTIAVSVKIQFQLTLLFSFFPFFYLPERRGSRFIVVITIATLLRLTSSLSLYADVECVHKPNRINLRKID